MLEAQDFWAAIDGLAEARGLPPAALARIANLPADALRPEMRRGEDGVLCWPSLEMVVRIAAATGIGLPDFARLVDAMQARRAPREPGS